MSITTEYQMDLIRTEEEFRALLPEWGDLYERSRPRNPCLSPEWAWSCWKHGRSGWRLFVLTARAEGQLVGIAPLRVERRLGFRVLRFLTKGFSPYAGFLYAPEHPRMEAALLDGLADVQRHWDLLHLIQLADPFTDLHRLAVPAGLRGSAHASSWKGGSYVAHDGDWEVVCREGPGWLKRVQRKVRKFEREGGVIERYTGSAAADHLEEAVFVERHSWKGRYGDAQLPHAHRRVINVLREALAALGPKGEMEVWIARLNGEPAASAINFLTPERIWLYRSAYHEDYARLGVGAVLDFLAIRQAWQEGRREYDYLSGDEPYKPDRTNAVRPVQQLCLYPASPRGSLAFGLLAWPRLFAKRSSPVRSALRVCARLKDSPKALLAGPERFRSRVQ